MAKTMKLNYPVKGIALKSGISFTQFFGENPQNYPGLKGHMGVDIGCPLGTPVYASHEGNITFREDPDGYGHHIYNTALDNAYLTIYGHLNSFVGNPRNVSRGELIGYSGSSGNSTGPHLHFGYRPLPSDLYNGYGGCVDPLPFLKVRAFLTGYRKHPEKDYVFRMDSMQTLENFKQVKEITDLFELEETEYTLPLNSPPFPTP